MASGASAADDNLARTLLIELLTHQFCSPVQWIRTQDTVLGDRPTERIVEMGPGRTLCNMLRRTLDSKYAIQDAAGHLTRHLLAFSHDLARISYDDASPGSATPPPAVARADAVPLTPSHAAPTSTAATLQPCPPPKAAAPAPTPSSGSIARIQDCPVAAVDVVPAIISAGLRRPLTPLDFPQNIKALSMGRSTLQNEIVGDLISEFPNLPDNAEDVPLEALCELLQLTYRGMLGKKSTSLIDKLSSQKLPGASPSSVVRERLGRRWGLGTGRQDSVLLRAVQAQPESRMNEQEAEAFFDGLAQGYIAQYGLALPDELTNSIASAPPTIVDAEAMEKMESRQRADWEAQLAFYAGLLGISSYASEMNVTHLQQRVAELQSKLDEWNVEHGEEYASGLRPIFMPCKARIYDSWWNWAMQDLLAFIATAGELPSPDRQERLSRLSWTMVNRSHRHLVSALKYFLGSETDPETTKLLQGLLVGCEDHIHKPSRAPALGSSRAPQTVVQSMGKIVYKTVERATEGIGHPYHFLQLARKGRECWKYVEGLSSTLWQVLTEIEHTGLCLAERNILITGAGVNSIGYILVARMLAAGAHVVVASSSYSHETARSFQSLYTAHGGKGSQLTFVPFNQASFRDVDALVDYVYDEKDGLGIDLDFLIPFAAISENGRSLSEIDSRSLLAHRLMLTNTIRLAGQIKRAKQDRGFLTRPTQIILPLSPNHGEFGNDGLYAESKLGLESLLEKFHSEDWADFLLICGVAIGWTRGTKLTSENDIVAEGIEKLGIRTFTQEEMAFNISALMTNDITHLCTDEPLIADFTGAMNRIPGLKAATTTIRRELQLRSEEQQMKTEDTALQPSTIDGIEDFNMQVDPELRFPTLPDWQAEIEPLAVELEGMVDLSRVVVVAGFAELGPWGNARVRWNMETDGFLSVESCIELAWSMSLIRAHSGLLEGQPFSGWLDRSTGEPIADMTVKDKYESYIMKHAGVRYMQRKQGSSTWKEREALHEIEITKDAAPFEVSREIAMELKQAHGENLRLLPTTDAARVKVVLTKGARIMVPKLIPTQHTVGGQLPKGWTAETYGVPDDIVRQVDPATVYALVTTAEALLDAGIVDPYELYEHVHVADVANCVGSGLGGSTKLRDILKGRYQDGNVPKDALAESFISSCSAWINMLLLSAAGANKTPVGACATALESLDTACELLQDGKAKVCLVGAFEDMLKEVSDEFANLHATIDVDADVARGREPREMSRPMTSTRAGFVEAEGAGIQVVTTASVALEMGLPIHAVVALTHTAMDRAGRSNTAPGRGLLGAAVQRSTKFDSPLMSMSYRRRTMQARLQQTEEMRDLQISHLDQIYPFHDPSQSSLRAEQLASILSDADRDRREARNQYGNRFWTHDDRIAPIRGALAVWGLTVDDIDVVSLHGTSTQANDINEAALLDRQFQHLGRSEGNLVPVVCQKSLTGHSKGPAGAWMLNGCLQMLRDGQIPGNNNADNIDAELRQYQHLVFPNKRLSRPNMKAFTLQLFGFGQKGAMAIGVHPRYLYATLPREQFDAYAQSRRQRERQASRHFSKTFFENNVFEAKGTAPYRDEEEIHALLDPSYRRQPQ